MEIELRKDPRSNAHHADPLRLRLSVLGQVEVGLDGRKPQLAPRSSHILAALASRRGAFVSTTDLAAMTWGVDCVRRSAIKAIHGYVFRLRKCTFDYVIVSEGSRYALNMDAVDIDAVEFERDLRDASDLYLEGRFGDALRLANAGLGKWKGSPYEGVSEAVLRAGEIRRLVEIWFRLREVRTQAQFAIGQFNASIGALEEEVATEPLREQSWFFLMTALHHTGRSVEALAAYSRARRVLAEALGIEPSRLLQLAEMRVLKNEPLHDLVLQGVRFAS